MQSDMQNKSPEREPGNRMKRGFYVFCFFTECGHLKMTANEKAHSIQCDKFIFSVRDNMNEG